MAIRRETIDGTEVAFQDVGSGPAVVLLHPFPLDHRVWADNVAALVADGRRVVALDYPGFGASPAPSAPLSIADLARLTVGLMDLLGLETATVGGESMGGYVALAVAAQARHRVGALILADTRAVADPPATRLGRAKALEAIQSKGVPAYLDQSIPKLVSPDADEALRARVRALAETKAASLIAAIEALRDRPDRSGELGAITCPALVIAGAQDQAMPPAEMRQMAGAIPGARFVEIPRVGHLSNFEGVTAFNDAVLDFLRDAVPSVAGPRR